MAYNVGDVAVLTYTLTDPTGAPADSTVTASATSPATALVPAGVTTALTVTRVALGSYTAPLLLTAEGDWVYTFTASGAVVDVTSGVVTALPAATIGVSPSVAAVHTLIPQRPPFTATSVPSAADVADIISRLAATIAAEFPLLPAALRPVAAAYIAYSAAALVETAYNPEQQFGTAGPATLLDQRAGVELTRLRALYQTGSARIGKRLGTVTMLPPEYDVPLYDPVTLALLPQVIDQWS